MQTTAVKQGSRHLLQKFGNTRDGGANRERSRPDDSQDMEDVEEEPQSGEEQSEKQRQPCKRTVQGAEVGHELAWTNHKNSWSTKKLKKKTSRKKSGWSASSIEEEEAKC